VEETTDFYKRLVLAMEYAKKSPTRTERECELSGGYMTSLKKGKIVLPGVEVVSMLADYLGVSFEWLARGRGPMLSDPETSRDSGLEAVLDFARRVMRAREDAVAAVLKRHRDTANDLAPADLLMEIDAEARRLDRAQVPRPEAVAQVQRTMSRLSKKKARLLDELRTLEEFEATLPRTAPKKSHGASTSLKRAKRHS
jgi:hypothetical protein